MIKNGSISFSGTVVRFERDGFAIIRFDRPIGPSANSFGLVSNSTGTAVSSDSPGFVGLKPGMRVTGVAEVDDRDVAAVKKVIVQSNS